MAKSKKQEKKVGFEKQEKHDESEKLNEEKEVEMKESLGSLEEEEEEEEEEVLSFNEMGIDDRILLAVLNA